MRSDATPLALLAFVLGLVATDLARAQEPAPAPTPQAAPAPSTGTAPVRVYGLELEQSEERERILIFAEQPVTYRVSEPDAATVALDLPGTLLDRSAARRLEPAEPGTVRRVRAFQRGDTPTPQIRVLIERSAGATPRLSRRGAMLAVDFERATPAAPASGIELRFRNEDIASIVRFVAAETGTEYLFDEQLRGSVTVSVADPVSAAEALEILQAALLLKGFVAVPTPGGPRKIVRISEMPGSAPWIPRELVEERENSVTTLVRLESANVDQMAVTLKPLVGSTGLALAYRPTNSLILASSERRLRRWIRLVRSLDQAELQQLIVRKLDYAPAVQAADLLSGLIGEPEGSRTPIEVWADERTNVLIVRSSLARLEEVREWISVLDVPGESSGEIRTLAVMHADVERLAQTLFTLSQGAGSGLPEALGPLAGRDFQVAVHPSTHSLVIRAEPDTHEMLRRVVRELDRPPPRVSVEVIVVELTTDESLALGFDALIPITDPKDPGDLIAVLASTPSGTITEPALDQSRAGVGRFTRGPLTIPIVDPLGQTIELVVPSDIYLVTADGREVRSRVLMRPHVVTLPGEEHEIFAGNNIPIPVGRTSGDGTTASALTLTQNIERQDVGVRLRVRPFVGDANTVRLELDLEETRIAPSVAGEVSAVGPTLTRRELSATLRLREGEYAVLGGLVQPTFEVRRVGTPFLKDLPILGALFRTTSETTLRSELVIAAQAWIHRSPSEDVAESIRRRLAFERSAARTAALRVGRDATYALLVTTLPSPAAAAEVARRVEADAGRNTRITQWSWRDGPSRYDVYVPGFETLAAASEASLRLSELGWSPELVVLAPEGDS